MIISVEKIKFQCQGAVQRPKHARVGVRARTQGDLMVGEGGPTRPKWFWVMIFCCYFVSGTLQSWYKCVFRTSEWKWQKEWNERGHIFYSPALIFAGTVNFFFPTSRGVPGAYTDKRHSVTLTWNTPKKCLFCLKEAERGWKSGATPLSWKSGWKPSTRREFWAQRGSGSFFRFRDMAVWSWFFCAIKFYIVKSALTQIPTSNGHISETKRAILDPLVPKFSSDRGLSPTLSWKWPSATLSPSFGLFQS